MPLTMTGASISCHVWPGRWATHHTRNHFSNAKRDAVLLDYYVSSVKSTEKVHIFFIFYILLFERLPKGLPGSTTLERNALFRILHFSCQKRTNVRLSGWYNVFFHNKTYQTISHDLSWLFQHIYQKSEHTFCGKIIITWTCCSYILLL